MSGDGILPETELSYISGNRTFLYFEKGIFRTQVYLELEAYSEPWHIHNYGIFRTMIYLEHYQTSKMESFAKRSHLGHLKKVITFSGNGTFWL